MIEFIEIGENELPGIIRLSYEGDEELLDKYHVEKFTLEQAVEKELEIIRKDTEVMELEYYKILYGENNIGYIVVAGDLVLSFAIAIKYRTKEILKEWWGEMIFVFSLNIKFGILSNNERAIKYFKDRGMKIAWENPEGKQKNDLLITY